MTEVRTYITLAEYTTSKVKIDDLLLNKSCKMILYQVQDRLDSEPGDGHEFFYKSFRSCK